MAFEISPQWRTWRSDLRENDETRLDEGEEPDVCPDCHGDAAENPDEPVASVEPREDVEVRPAAVEESGSGRDLRDDVAEDPREHVAAVEPLDGVEETRGSVEDLVAVNPAVDLRPTFNDIKLLQREALTHSATAACVVGSSSPVSFVIPNKLIQSMVQTDFVLC